MAEQVRRLYEDVCDQVAMALTPALLAHRDHVLETYATLPLECWANDAVMVRV